MNRKYDEISSTSWLVRKKEHKLIREGTLIKKDYLYKRFRHCGELGIDYNNIKFLEENMFLIIPFPFKQQ